MNSALQLMLDKYDPKNNIDRENTIKEIIQEIVLSGLSRSDFFTKVAFYGGTCLRIFHGLNRFSEDLDFALIQDNALFSLQIYFPYIKKELDSYGINMDIVSKEKRNISDVQTAFVKGNSQMLVLQFFPNSEEAKQIVGNQKIKIKFEIDTENPAGGTTEIKYKLLPAPYEIKVFDESTLFAGKIHAVICREYSGRVKGRDYYDYLFYCGKGTKVNLKYLENKLKNTGKIGLNDKFTIDDAKKLLIEKFNSVDYEAAKRDVSAFISDKSSLDIWSKDLFISTVFDLKEK